MHIHGFKKQKGQAQKPHIAPDDLVSVSYANILYGLGEGEIMGLSDGGKSIKLDGTPLINDNGQPNFMGVNWEFRMGTLDQSHIAGFPAVENETNVGVELRHDRPWVKAITNRELSAVRVRLNFNALREQKDNGDVMGYAIAYAIDVQTDGGSFVEVLTDTVRGKSSQGYKKSHRIDLPNAGTAKRWTVRVRRITPNRNSDLIADTVHIDALTEIIDAKLAYPCTALLGLSYDAKTFSNIAKLAVRLKGKIIQVPSNYNADTRTYNGLWDGTFKMAYSNNPAWVFYDLCTHKRYGLGERLSGMVDKWRLYQIGQYCDELVDDGKGGQEPRFTVNVYIQKADDAYRVLQNLASVFRGLSFWDGQNIVVDSDTPKEAVYIFSPTNVVGGEFAYTGTRARDRHTLAKVAWDNPDNGFNTEYELIPDEGAIARYGVKVLDIAAFGCTSKGQAQRAGLWALKAEQLETQTVSFKTGLQGFIPQVGQVINIADNVFAGRAISGKIVAVADNQKTITLDRVAGKVGDTITVNGTDGVQSAKIVSVRDTVLTLDKPINAQSEHIWAVISDDLKLKQFRILTIAQNDDATFDITALEYNAQKYAVVDTGAVVVPQPYTVLKATPITAPNSVTLSASTRTVQGQAVTTLTINWEQVTGAVAYIVKWRKDDGNWQTLPKVSGQSVDIDGVYAGNYTAQVQAVDAFDNESLATSSQLTPITGKTGKPPRLARLTAKGVLFGMELFWDFNAGSDDTNFTEIEVSPDGRSNITTLGTFAYPTNKHEITGLQGNLTQYYRARIVDKLGNTSDWTAWVRGVTDNNADKVLDILSGQINQSHLDQTLRTPISKIGGLENAVNAVNGNLSTLNSQLANTKNELATAKATLQTAVSNITTERNRINTAIRDITALQSANNAKTQEIANLTNTVGSHTSSIRELGVTTGDLSQKYTQLKTASDTANSEITAIKQTQNGQATSIERLGAKFDSLAVGGRNYAEDGNFNRGLWFATKHANSDATFSKENGVLSINGTNTNWKQWQIQSKEGTRANIANTSSALALLQDGETYTLSVEARSDSDTGGLINLKIADDRVSGSTPARIDVMGKNNIALTTEWKRYFITGMIRKSPEHNIWRIILEAHTATQPVYFRNVKLEKGSIPTDYTPAPEDTQSQLDEKTSTASLNEFKQTSANADKALGERITAIDTAYKQADTATNAKLAQAEKAISDNNTALSQRITALDTAYKKSDTDITARLAREETARTNGDNANSQAIRTLESTVNGVSGRVGTSESKIATLERTTANTNQALATAQSQMNARFDNLAVGGRNLILKSDVSYSGYHSGSRPAMMVSNDVAGATTLTLSADIEVEGNPNTTYAIANRAGVSTRLVYTDGSTQWFEIWQSVENYKGRMARTFNVPNGKTLANINVCNIQTRLQATKVIVSRPKLERGNIATDWTPAPEDLQVDLSPYATNSSLNEFKQAQATKDTATAQKLSQLESGLNGKASSVALEQLNTKVNQVDGKITAEAQKVSTLQTTVNSQTASIQQHAQSLNGLSAQWTLKVQSGNIVSGIGLASNNGVSDFAIRADKFYIAPPTGTAKGVSPFMVLTRPTVINGTTVPAGTYINSAFIHNGSIDIAKINKASISSLSAITATIGTLRTKTSGARTEIKDNLIEVYDSNNKLRVRMGVW